ncbi:uncharacterized protein LOC126970504 isoform X4 [Leptidea sinapis]|uniref:uncharacterized protein LOC126970504 isoform X4 n=1 Tax=Leptidea sinapis TaxID=189913 RepID=UPI0021C375F5|nr:uncharacterized protein LOC126970504 isoform X4 [Leptidea sinapis]
MAAAPASCMSAENGCVMFDCLVHLWEWIDPPVSQNQFQMDNKKILPSMQQPLTQQHLMAHHVHPDQIYSQQQMSNHANSTQPIQNQPNGVIHQHVVQNQYHANMNARSPLLENRHELYGSHNHEYARHYGANDNYNYQQSPSTERSDQIHVDHNVNYDIMQNIPKGYNAEVYQDYLKRNPPKDNQIYQNHQPMYRPNVNQYGSKPYLPYTNRIGPQSNTELLRRQYNEIQQLKMQQQLHYQSQAQMHQQQKFAERQLLLQQIHGIQPPPNLQNSIYSDSSYGDLNKYGSRNDFKDYGADIHKDIDEYAKNNEYRERDNQNKEQDREWQYNQEYGNRETERYKGHNERDLSKSRSPPSDFNNQLKNIPLSPLKSSESSSPSIKSPSSESRRSSSGQALRSPTAQRIPSAPVTISGILYKQGSDGLKVWRKRWFVLSEYCLFYYKSQDEEKLLGSVLLPSYKVSACTSEDKVMRKFAFKLEHANMRTYVLAALDQDSMLKWVKALTMAALMQNFSDQMQRQNDRDTVKAEDDDEVPGPTYANAPPKPRRSNDGYNSPGSDIYDPNYDLLRTPASQYNMSTAPTQYQASYKTSPPNQQSTQPQHTVYQTKHHNENTNNPAISKNMDRSDINLDAISPYNAQSSYDTRSLSQHKQQEQYIYNQQRNLQTNPFLQHYPSQDTRLAANSIPSNQIEDNKTKSNASQNDIYLESKNKSNTYVEQKANPDVYGELSTLKSRASNSTVNDRVPETRTPDAYSRAALNHYKKGKNGDYEDVYSPYANENELPKLQAAKSPNISQRDNISISSHATSQKNYQQPQEKVFSGPSVLRRKKMQASGVQQQMPRPHSADFLEYESKNELLNKSLPARNVGEGASHQQRPKSSLDINSFYDPSSETYYSEEGYAEKMRQSAQYLQQQGLAPRNIQIPLAKYASGLAEKQLSSPYTQISENNNYETEFSGRHNRDNVSYTSKYSDIEVANSNWMLKEKGGEHQKDYLNRSGSVMSDGSNASFMKDAKLELNNDGFMRSASARLPSTMERDGEKKVQQREESMKRLQEWKQRMLQSPLTRKSTPATISLARSLNQSRQSLRSDQYKPKTHSNAPYNSYSSDDEASMTISANETNKNNNQVNQQILSKKSCLGSNTSIGRNNRDGNIPVRAVSPRVRWVEESGDQYNLQQMSTSQQNLNALSPTEDSWTVSRSPSRASQQPISAVSPRVRRNTDTSDLQKEMQARELLEVPTAGELLGRSHEELVLLLIQLRRRHAATHRSIEQCCIQISSIEECLSSLKAIEREESLRRLEQLKMQLMDLEQQYAKSKPLVHLVDNMVKLGSLYNRPGSTIERLERNQRLRHKVLAEHALEQQRWLESAAAGKPLETEAARVRVAELWALEQELADEASILQGLKTDKDAIDNLLTGVRQKVNGMKLDEFPGTGGGLEAELARVHAMLAHNSKVYKKLEHTVAENARLERELQQLRRALRARRASAPHQNHPAHPPHQSHPTAMLEDEVTRVQQLVSALQRQRQELSRAVRTLTQQSQALQTTHDSMPGNRQQQGVTTNWQETNLDTGHTKDHGHHYDYDSQILRPGHYGQNVEPLYVDTRSPNDVTSPMSSQDMQHSAFSNLSNVEKQEIKTVRIVKRESERRQRDRERSLQPMSDWSGNNITNIDQFLEEELVQPLHNYRAASVPRTDYTKFEEYSAKQNIEAPYLRFERNMELSPKYPSSPSLSNYDFSRDLSLSSSYQKSYDRSPYDKMSTSTQYLNSPTDSSRTLTNDPISKTSSVMSLTRSNFELSPIFKSEAAKQIITEMSDTQNNGSLHRRQVPKEKRRHNTAPHHLSAKTLNELPREGYKHDAMARSVDDADMERALRGAAPDVVRSALPSKKMTDSIDQLLAAPQKILIPERYIPEKPPELSPEEQQKRQEKVESIKKMLTSTSADPNKSPDGPEKRQREHLLQMNQILAKQVTEMSKIIAVKALEDLPTHEVAEDSDRSPDVELPIYQQRENFFT